MWEREFIKFEGEIQRAPTICSYEKSWEIRYDISTLIIDEAHYLKSIDARRAEVILGKDGLIHKADRVWFLSGTPAPNNPSELWTILHVCGVTKLSYDAFMERYCKTRATPYGKQVTGTCAENLPELRKLLSTFMLRRTKAEVRPDMPRVMISDLVVEPGPVDLEVEFFSKWRSGGDANVMRHITNEEKLVDPDQLDAIQAQVGSWRRYVGLQKVQPVTELVTDWLTQDRKAKVVLFAWHKAVIEGLRRGLRQFDAVTLYGNTNPNTRQENIDKVQNWDPCRVIIGNTLAAGTAIGLHAAHQGLMVEPDWVPGTNAQAIMRMDGPAQKEAITVQFVSIAGSIDEQIARTLSRKTKMLSDVFD